MPSRKEKLAERASDVILKGDAPLRASKLPVELQFPLVVILSLSSSALLFSLTAEYTGSELSAISRVLDQWWEVGVLLAWRTFELALGWYGNYDSYDLASLSILTHGPLLYLLRSFYAIPSSTILLSLTIDILVKSIPFRLLRPLSQAHAASASASAINLPNGAVVTDLSIQILTALLAAGIYSVTLYTAYASYLPVALVTYFDDIPSIQAAHSATPITLIPVALVLGFAARSFIFTPAMACSTPADVPPAVFDPTTATLAETLRRNLWDYQPRTRVFMVRTATLMLLSGFNSFLQVFMTVEGVQPVGAAIYASVWVVAALLTGLSLGVVSAV